MSTAEPAVTQPTQTGIPTGTWNVDPVHSSVEFQVKHLGIATVKGQFKEFEGALEVTPEGTRAYGKVNVASVDTREPQRDEHLRSPDFFEAENYPEITFQSTSIEPVDEDTFACLRLAREAARAGGTAPCTLNAANEVAV